MHVVEILCSYMYACVIVSLGGGEMGTAAVRFYHMLSAASATGEYEKVCHGKKCLCVPACLLCTVTCNYIDRVVYIMHGRFYF